MRVRILLAAVILSAVATALPAADPSIAARGRIVEVTVFRDRAEVVREARVDLPAGASTVGFERMPFGVDPDSIRVTATGVAATIGAVEIKDEAEEPAESAELEAAKDEVTRLEREIAAVDGEGRVDAELRGFITSIKATTAQTESEKIGAGRPDPQAISGVYGVLADKLGELTTRSLARDERLRELREALAVAKAHLATLRPQGDIRSRVATVEVEAPRAGALTLRLAYLVPGASWRPGYRASLDANSGSVALTAEGVVRQVSGEDWSGVKLRLSTAAPTQGVAPPILAPWILRPIEYAQKNANSIEEMEAYDSDGARYQNVTAMAPGGAPEAPPVPAEMAQADVVRSAYNVAFEVPGTSDVAADGRDHRVVLRNDTLAGKQVWRTVPAADPRAFLTSVTTSPADYPLLAGTVRVFAEGAYLGSFVLEEKGPGTETTFPFGVDNRVEIVRVPLPRSKTREGLSGKQKEVDFAFKTEIANLLDRPITLILEDRVPVAEDERISVEIGKDTTPGYEDSARRPGVKLWTFELAPKEKREVVLAYSVRYPRDMHLPDID